MKFLRKFLKIPNKLALKIPLMYFVIILLTVALSSTVLNKISSDAAQNKVNEATLKTIASIKTNVNFMIENVNNSSKMLLSDNNLQDLLRQGNVYSNLQMEAKMSKYVYTLIQAEPIINDVYIFDNSGNRFFVGQPARPLSLKKNIKDTSWYRDVLSKRGKYILRLNGGGAFVNTKTENFVSLIRLIRDVNNVKSLGIMMINIPTSAFLQFDLNVVDENSQQIVLLDENNQIIVPNTKDNKSVKIFEQALAENQDDIKQKLSQSGSNYITLHSFSQQYLISYLLDEESGWKYVSIMPMNFANTQNRSFALLSIAFLLVNGIVFFVSSVFISKNTITPIHQLLQSMKNANQGRFCEINAKPTSEEFERLFDGYNIMIRQINQLLEKIIQEQKTIRKAELNTLQAQIKPHFLYNTLDSIASLALSGESEQVCYLVESLGNYYRVSVSKGKEVISIGEEVEMVRNYLNIQKVRYPDLFEVIYDVEDSCLDYPILKLVLQPLVENSLYHGIREKGAWGTILIKARDVGDAILLSVIDDGVGMSKDEVQAILMQERSSQVKSFGLWGTMERIRIFYGRENCIKIESEPEKGTKITLTIPKGEC